MLSAAEVRTSVARLIGRPQVNHILHGFPSLRLWDDGAPSDDPVRRRAEAQDHPLPLDLYVSIPFCLRTEPDRCGYCLFPTEHFERSSQLRSYLDLLDREAEVWAHAFAHRPVRSVYIGGGTPNLLRSDQYQPLMDLVRRRFPLLPPADRITLEGIPQLFGRSRLEAIAAAGIGRISMGAQQLDTDLAALSGRQQTAEHVLEAVADATDLGLASNVDLIFGWPRQTVDTMLADLDRLQQTSVDHITHYELNVGGPTDFALNRRHELPDRATVEAMYLEASRALRGWGFEQRTSYDFERSAPSSGFVYEECERGFELHEVVGWGQGAITELVDPDGRRGWSTINERSLHGYEAGLERPEGPIERSCSRAPIDVRLLELHRSVQGLAVDGGRYASVFGVGLDEFATSWDVLEEEGLVERRGADVALTERGGYFVPTIQATLAAERLGELKDARWEATRGSADAVAVAIRER
jgi:oxygen-independent coproporphyrinogen-3 oxidase